MYEVTFVKKHFTRNVKLFSANLNLMKLHCEYQISNEKEEQLQIFLTVFERKITMLYALVISNNIF